MHTLNVHRNYPLYGITLHDKTTSPIYRSTDSNQMHTVVILRNITQLFTHWVTGRLNLGFIQRSTSMYSWPPLFSIADMSKHLLVSKITVWTYDIYQQMTYISSIKGIIILRYWCITLRYWYKAEYNMAYLGYTCTWTEQARKLFIISWIVINFHEMKCRFHVYMI